LKVTFIYSPIPSSHHNCHVTQYKSTTILQDERDVSFTELCQVPLCFRCSHLHIVICIYSPHA